mmetsp:Transcript_6360/g.26367  ORF Transcript_6360/g.26367 Transcript_6360/m.26367 type:complete len:369 (-) Transcript_6360:401-1507(-)
MFDAQGAGLGGSVAPLDGARVAAAVLDAEPAELDRGGAPLHGAPLAAAVGPAKAEPGVPLLAAGSLAHLNPAVRRAEALEVTGLIAALVRASLAPPVRDAIGAAGGALGAAGHLASLAAAVGDAESAAGVHLLASNPIPSLVRASLAAAVRAASIASGRRFRDATHLGAFPRGAAAVILALSPGARGAGASRLRADLLAGVVLDARAPRLGALVAALVGAPPDPAVRLAQPVAEIFGRATGDDAGFLLVDPAVDRALTAHLAHAVAALLGASQPAAVGHAERTPGRRARLAPVALASLTAAVRDASAAAAVARVASLDLAALAPAVGGALTAADIQLVALVHPAPADVRRSVSVGRLGEHRGDGVGGE